MQVRQKVVRDFATEDLADLMPSGADLVMVFAAPRHFESSLMSEALARSFPGAQIIGASTAGEIGSAGVSEDSAVVTAVHFDHTKFAIAQTDLMGLEDSRASGARLASALPKDGLKAALLFSQGVAVNGSDVIAGITGVLGKDVLLTGGLAGDYGAFTRTYTLLDGDVSDHRMILVGLYGERLHISHGSFGGWQAFGPVRQATRAEGNVLFELDGAPALEVYKRYLGDYAEGLPASGLLFPFALLSTDRQDSGLIRTLLAVDHASGSLTLAGDVPQGAFLRLMHASTEALVDGAEAAAQAASDMLSGQPGLAILVSCVGRKLVMGDRVDEEIEAVGAVFGQGCVLAGFYSNGEVSPLFGSTDCKLHNQTMTITGLTEA
jgi:hypothetical protein